MSHNKKIGVLFVCLGNICRSPLGEGIFRYLVNEAGLSECFIIDSAGTSGYNVGDKPDPQARRVARSHGVFIDDIKARKLERDDLEKWDYIIAMDNSNFKNIERLGKVLGRLYLMREFDLEGCGDVPDPWCMGDSAFHEVYDMIERSCINLLETIKREYSLNILDA